MDHDGASAAELCTRGASVPVGSGRCHRDSVVTRSVPSRGLVTVWLSRGTVPAGSNEYLPCPGSKSARPAALDSPRRCRSRKHASLQTSPAGPGPLRQILASTVCPASNLDSPDLLESIASFKFRWTAGPQAGLGADKPGRPGWAHLQKPTARKSWKHQTFEL
jgi:hypothetical protein